VASLYRYLSEARADEFVRFGRILFHSLSFYRDCEDGLVRGDEYEGTRRFRPNEGLTITHSHSNKNLLTPNSFESSAKEEDIFVYCLSTKLDPAIAERFGTTVCVEIMDPKKFISKVYYAIPPRLTSKSKEFIHGPVRYYKEHEPPIGDWALPEKITMAKPEVFSWQEEYRLAFPIRNAFRVENVQVKLVPPGERRKPRLVDHPCRHIELGRLSEACNIWRFD